MPDANGSTENDISAGKGELALSELIEAASASAVAFPDTEEGRLMDSFAIGTGFDIALIQQGLLPPIPSSEIENPVPEADLASSCPNETGIPAETGASTFNETYAAFAIYQLDPSTTPQQHY